MLKSRVRKYEADRVTLRDAGTLETHMRKYVANRHPSDGRGIGERKIGFPSPLLMALSGEAAGLVLSHPSP